MLRRLRAVIRLARESGALRPGVAALDRLWWARTIRRAKLVDPHLVRAQGHRGGPTSAIRRYVRGGFREGFALHPLLLEKLVASQLSDVGRVPALYAYLINDTRRVLTTVAWDARSYAQTHPHSVDTPGGPIGDATQQAQAGEALDILGIPTTWSSVSCVAQDAARASVQAELILPRHFSTSLAFVCRLSVAEEASSALQVAETIARHTDVAVIIALPRTVTDLWIAASLLQLRHPTLQVVSDTDDLLARLFALQPDAIFIVRGPGGEISADDLLELAAHASDRAVAPLWLDSEDGTIASAGLLTLREDAAPLLRGHPAEDADALPELIPVAAIDSATFAGPAPGRRLRSPAILARARVHTARRDAGGRSTVEEARLQEPLLAAADELDRLLAPLGMMVDRSFTDDVRLLRSERHVVLADGRTVPRLRWAIKIAAPPGRRGQWWGDTHFAQGLAAALRRQGQEVVVDAYAARNRPTAYLDDVVVALRGPEPISPQPGAVSILWIISHPDQIKAEELRSFDAVFAASEQWAGRATEQLGRLVRPLLQCTDVNRFHPQGLAREDDLVFVGTARGIPRPSVIEPIRAGFDVSVYGPDWTGWIPGEAIKGIEVPNAELPAVYERAGAVLNDHWPAMQREGFVSNRLFDVVSAGGRAISDEVSGIAALFQGAVRTYSDTSELITLLSGELNELFPDEAELSTIAASVRAHHSFDARATELIDTALSLRGHNVSDAESR